METIIFPSAQAMILKLLRDLKGSHGLDFNPMLGTPAEDSMPNVFTRVSRVGGNRVDIVLQDAHVLVECYAANELQADLMARRIHALLCGLRNVHVVDPSNPLADGLIVSIAESSGLVEFYDNSLSKDRTQFTLRVRLRGETLS